ncbi:hypothetical protein QFZ81_002987 [Paenibacillus sp. V4I9]|uniref:Cthe_2314 family HEPN domain-containing protein n=1 Tax=Paenibacillus sp. V4I9 TaxID=3042308 RepID=UPI00277EAC45|nr:Cthe_2314 family HEPN domain-containing protein [Paenibacillus sp. V4I9]MDQ0887899.1 hypothetical protein [Paenibacillus sp. V4I9]
MFNVAEDDYIKHQDLFPDFLRSTAESYNEYLESHEEIFFMFNQHLKYFPVINSWRIDIFGIWDICRMSVICAHAVYFEKLKDMFSESNISEEIIYYSGIVEYYLENFMYRSFGLLEKMAHAINITMGLGLSERMVSYHKVKDLMTREYPNHDITKELNKFENDCDILSDVRETRNAITHRSDPLSPGFVFEEIEFGPKEREPWENGLTRMRAQVFNQKDAKLDTDRYLDITIKFFFAISKVTGLVFLNILYEIDERFQNEQEHFHGIDFKQDDSNDN